MKGSYPMLVPRLLQYKRIEDNSRSTEWSDLLLLPIINHYYRFSYKNSIRPPSSFVRCTLMCIPPQRSRGVYENARDTVLFVLLIYSFP